MVRRSTGVRATFSDTRLLYWHIASLSAVQRYVRSWGQTGSDRPTVKTALMTHTGRSPQSNAVISCAGVAREIHRTGHGAVTIYPIGLSRLSDQDFDRHEETAAAELHRRRRTGARGRSAREGAADGRAGALQLDWLSRRWPCRRGLGPHHLLGPRHAYPGCSPVSSSRPQSELREPWSSIQRQQSGRVSRRRPGGLRLSVCQPLGG